MSAFEIALLAMAGFAVALFFGARTYLLAIKPSNGPGLELHEARRAWMRKAEKTEKVLNPILLLSVAGFMLGTWVVIRVVISFI